MEVTHTFCSGWDGDTNEIKNYDKTINDLNSKDMVIITDVKSKTKDKEKAFAEWYTKNSLKYTNETKTDD